MKRLAFCLLVVLSGCSTAPVDLSGQWAFHMDRDFAGNPDARFECAVKQQRSALTVTCGPPGRRYPNGEMKGEVHGRKVTWGYEKTGIPPMLEDRLVLAFTGELDESQTIKGNWSLNSSVLNEKGPFQATKKP